MGLKIAPTRGVGTWPGHSTQSLKRLVKIANLGAVPIPAIELTLIILPYAPDADRAGVLTVALSR